MSKSDKKKSRSSDKFSLSEVKIIEIDEAIFGRISEKIERQENRFNHLIERQVNSSHLLKSGLAQDKIDFEDAVSWEIEAEEIDKHLTRIRGVLCSKNLEVNEANLTAYLTYLRNNINLPCLLTGIEAFEWEDYYVLGPGHPKEYEKLKKTKACHTDTFKLIGFKDLVREEEGIFVEVQRVTDNKKFTLPLSDLEAIDEESANAELLDDYAVWFVNYI